MVEVGDREVADPEQGEVEHRVAGARLAEEEEREADDADDHRHPDQRVAPAVRRLLDQGEDRAAEPERPRADAEPVDPAERVRVAALLDRVEGERRR